MIMQFNKHNLFSIPIYKIKVDPKEYDKETFLKIVKKNYDIDPTRCNHFPGDGEFGNLHHSYADTDNKNFEDVDYQGIGLTSVYTNICKSFCNELKTSGEPFDWKWTLENYTAITEKNQYMRPHSHLPLADFASVHYISFDKEMHKPTNFINSNKFASYLKYIRPYLYKLSNPNDLDTSYQYINWLSSVEENDMVIFPACLEHEIPRQDKQSDKLRVTVSCNFEIVNKKL